MPYVLLECVALAGPSTPGFPFFLQVWSVQLQNQSQVDSNLTGSPLSLTCKKVMLQDISSGKEERKRGRGKGVNVFSSCVMQESKSGWS